MRSARVELILDTLRAVRGARDLTREVGGTAKALGDTARQGERAGRAVDDAGDEMSEAARAAAAYDRQVEQLTGSLRQLAIQSALTGDVDVAKRMREQQRQLSQLNRGRKLLGDGDAKGMGVDLGATLGVSTAQGFFAAFSATIKGGGPAIMGPLIAAGAAAAPVFVSAMASAMASGAGLGVIGVGVMALAKDPDVAAAGKEAGGNFAKGLQREASQAFKGPVLASLQQLDAAGQRVTRRLGQAFVALGPAIEPFTAKVIGAGEAVVNSLAGAAERSGPALDGLGDSVTLLGDGVSSFIDSVADGGPEAADNLRLIAGATADVVKHSGAMLNIVNKLSSNEWITGPLLPLVRDHYKGAADASDEMRKRTEEAHKAALEQEAGLRSLANVQVLVKADTDQLKVAQGGLKDILQAVGAEASVAQQRSDALRRTQDALFGSTMKAADANQSYEASWDGLSTSVKKNKSTLDVHTAAGRNNRDALKNLITSTNDLYFAEIAAGTSVANATKKHHNRIAAIKEEARRQHLNREQTNLMIKTYGRIPPKKTTDIVLSKVAEVADALLDLAAVQLHLAKGTPLGPSLSRRLARAQYAMPDTKRAHGGLLPGHAPHDRADNMIYWGTPGEHVIQRPTVRKVERTHGPGAMDYFNRYGELPAFASGGRLAQASRVSWGGPGMDFRVSAGMTKVPTMERVIAAVPFVINSGNWPSSPAAVRYDSGRWREIERFIRSTGPLSGSFGNGYRPGDDKWHGSGWALDWMGFNQDALAQRLAAMRPLELIHRTRNRDYAYTRGQNKGSFNEALMEAHRNHIHIAMRYGGVIPEHVVGVGRSGRSYEFAERGPERVTPMWQSGSPSGGPGIQLQITFAGPVGSRVELENWLTSAVDSLKRKGKL